MRLIKTYLQKDLQSWERAESRVFAILGKLTLDELKDICVYRGIKIDGMTKRTLKKAFMVGMNSGMQTNKHFSKL
jgi:hypothetical protein